MSLVDSKFLICIEKFHFALVCCVFENVSSLGCPSVAILTMLISVLARERHLACSHCCVLPCFAGHSNSQIHQHWGMGLYTQRGATANQVHV